MTTLALDGKRDIQLVGISANAGVSDPNTQISNHSEMSPRNVLELCRDLLRPVGIWHQALALLQDKENIGSLPKMKLIFGLFD